MLKNSIDLQNLEEIFKALANKSRLEALSLILSEGEASLQSLSTRLGVPLKTASRNLAILKRAGFLTARNDQGRLVYEINSSGEANCIITLLVLVKDATS